MPKAPVDMSQHFGWRALLRYTAPAIAMSVFTSIYGIVDGFFVSNFAGKEAFAAVNFVMPVIMILSTLGFMVGSGGTALVSKIRGEGNENLANQCFSLLTYFTIVMGILLSVVGFFIARPISALMGAEGEMLDYCVVYMRISMISLTFFMLQFAFQNFFACAGKPKVGFWVTVASGMANIVLDAVLVGALGLGVEGAAAATVTSEIVGGGGSVLYFALKHDGSLLRLGRTTLMWKQIGQALFNGLSEFMGNIALSLVSVLYNVQLMHYMGENGVAVYGVIMYMGMVFSAVFYGYTIGAGPLMSYQYGANCHKEMRNLLVKGFLFAFVCGLAMLALAQAGAGLIANVFCGYDELLCSQTEYGFRVYSVSFLMLGISIYGSALFTALNNGLVSAVMSFVRTLVFEVGAVILVPLLFGGDAIWFSVIVAETASMVLVACFVFGLRNKYGYLEK